MNESSGQPPLGELLSERQHLLNIGFRMLGTVSDAEDVVQETYARWFRLSDAEREAIAVPGAWLTRVAGRICLDILGSARARRELYVGEWLPEPVPESSAGDPLDRITLDDSVTMALLVVLESLSPAERVALVLHDVFAVPFDEIAEIVGRTPQACRKLASSARAHVRVRRTSEATAAEHARVVAEFAEACATGDLARLIAVLDPGVVTRSDGGGRVRAALKPVMGADRSARFVLGILSKQTDLVPSLETISGRTGVAVRRNGVVSGVVTFNVRGGLISDVWVVLNPEKLSTWGVT
jgi:RNA polymerase sigma-70 factor, ECF subfamily